MADSDPKRLAGRTLRPVTRSEIVEECRRRALGQPDEKWYMLSGKPVADPGDHPPGACFKVMQIDSDTGRIKVSDGTETRTLMDPAGVSTFEKAPALPYLNAVIRDDGVKWSGSFQPFAGINREENPPRLADATCEKFADQMDAAVKHVQSVLAKPPKVAADDYIFRGGPVEPLEDDDEKPIGRLSITARLNEDRFRLEDPRNLFRFEVGDAIEFSPYGTRGAGSARSGRAHITHIDRDGSHIRVDAPLYMAVPAAAAGDFIYLAREQDDEEDEEPKHEYSVAVTCRCGYTTVKAIGDCDPKQYACSHNLEYDEFGDALKCNCGFSLSGEALAVMGFRQGGRYDHKGNALADEAQRLRDENASICRENVALRREVERLGRKK